MVSYGPWTQEPDYEIGGYYTDDGRLDACVALGLNFFPRAYAYGSITSEGGPTVYTDGSLMALFELVEDAVIDPIRESTSAVTRVLRSSGIIVFGPPDVYENYGIVAIGHTPYPVRFFPQPFFPELPDGAVGVEWQDEQPPSEFNVGFSERLDVVLAATSEIKNVGLEVEPGLTYSMRISVADLSRAQNQTYYGVADVGDPGDTHSLAVYFRDTIEGEAVDVLGDDLDFTEYVDDLQSGVAVLYTSNTPFLPYENPSGYEEEWEYGTRLHRPYIRSMYRPPVYRFIYDTVPIRQTSHRDDHLAGGAFQTWPTPRSEQGSNQTFGGYR